MNWDRRAERDVRANATVRRVRQIGATDCGIAAVAMIANVPYTVAHKAVGRSKGQRSGTTIEECWDALERLGVKIERVERRFTSWSGITTDALVCVRWRFSNDDHWLVYQKRANGEFRLLDPAADGDTLTLVHTWFVKGRYYSLVEAVKRRGPPDHTNRRKTPEQSAVEHQGKEELGCRSVTEARRSPELKNAISRATGLSSRSVGARLRAAHGRTLVRNVFRDVWPIKSASGA